jgi:hypothetical protein
MIDSLGHSWLGAVLPCCSFSASVVVDKASESRQSNGFISLSLENTHKSSVVVGSFIGTSTVSYVLL